MADNIDQIENAIIRETAMTDSLIEERTNEAQELIFKFLGMNLEAYISDPQAVIQKLTQLIQPGIASGFDEAIDNGIRLSDTIERSAR